MIKVEKNRMMSYSCNINKRKIFNIQSSLEGDIKF